MNAKLLKEIRLLLPVWAAAVVLVALPFQWMPRWNDPSGGFDIDFAGWGKGIGFVLGILLLTVSVFGREIAGGMWKTVLSQPVSRKEIWMRKLAVFGVGAVLVWLIFWVSSGMGERFSWRIGVASLAVAGAMGGTGLAATLLFRQVLPAFAFSLLLPSLLVPVLGPMAEKGFPGWVFGAAVLVVAAYAVAAFRWSYALFSRAEDLGPWLGDLSIRVPGWKARGEGGGVGREVAVGRPGRSLLAKEWRLQQVNLVCGGVVLLLALAVEFALSGSEQSETGDGFRTAYSLLILLLPLLAGAVAVAEERKPGLLAAQRMLPVSAGRQFCVKLAVTAGVALLLGVLLPALVAGAVEAMGGIAGEEEGMGPAGLAQILGFRLAHLESRIAVLAAYALAAVAVSFFASSISRGTLGALVLAVVLFGAGGMAVIVVQEFWAGGYLWAWVWMATGILVCAGLVLGNFRTEMVDGRVWRRNFAVIVAGGALATGATAFTFYRTWELFLEDPTAGIGSAEPLLADGADIYRVPGGWSRWLVHLPDGRFWVGEESREAANGYSFPEDGEFLEIGDWVKVVGSWEEICGIRPDGSLWRIFGARSGLSIEPLAEGKWIDLSGGKYHLLAVREDGTLWGWGWSGVFRLEHEGSAHYIRTPERVGDDTDWVRIFASVRESLGVKRDGSVRMRAPGGGGFRWVQFRSELRAVGGSFGINLAVREDGTLWRWGTGWSYSKPLVRLGNRSDWKAADATHWDAVVALDQSGVLWGGNVWQASDRWNSESVIPTEKMSGESGWVAILADDDGFHALARDGSFWIWGRPAWREDREDFPLLAPSRWGRRVGK